MFVESLKPFTQTSIDFLTAICDDDDFIALTYDSFVALTSNSERTSQNFEQAIVLTKTELRAQICFDLCTFYLHNKKYDLARINVIACRNNLAELKKQYKATTGKNEFVFCTLNEDELYGCMLACGVGDQKLGLLHRMNESMLHHYKDITDILKADNLSNEIPLVNRRILELDIEGKDDACTLKSLHQANCSLCYRKCIQQSVTTAEGSFVASGCTEHHQNHTRRTASVFAQRFPAEIQKIERIGRPRR